MYGSEQSKSIKSPARMINLLVCLDKIMNAPAAAVLSELELLRNIVNSSVDLTSVIGRDYKFLYANPAYLRYFSKEPADIIGHALIELIGESIFREQSKPLLDRTFKGESGSYFARFDFPGVGMRDAQVFTSPARNRVGEIVGAVAVLRDVEELERARSALRRRQSCSSGSPLRCDRLRTIEFLKAAGR